MIRLNILTKEKRELIHATSLDILQRVGVVVKNQKAMELLSNAGCMIEGDVVMIPPSLVEECLNGAPEEFDLHNRDGKKVTKVGGDEVIFNPGSSVSNIWDPETNETRKALAKDLLETIIITDALEHIKAQSTAIIPSDIPQIAADFYRLYMVLRNSAKPIITGAFRKEGVADMARLIDVFIPEEELKKKPFVIFDCCPLSPLTWGDVSTQNLLDCSARGIPAEIVPAPLMGATSPITLAGTLAQMNAEILAGVVIAQLNNPGCPVIYGGAPAPLDMRYATPRYGAIEMVLVACAAAEMGKQYGMPTHSYLGIADGKTIDAQLGFESGVGLMIGAAAGINVISGPGAFIHINCLSLEKLVIDNEICGSAMRLKRGIDIDGLAEVVEIIKAVKHSGEFLKQRHTAKNLREEHFIPSDIIDRKTEDDWVQTGKKSAVGRARERVQQILASEREQNMEKELAKLLDTRISEVMNKYKVSVPQ